MISSWGRGFWGEGVLGGKVDLGIIQGKILGSRVNALLKETTGHIAGKPLNQTGFYFDGSVARRFDLEIDRLPYESVILHAIRATQRDILILGSYHRGHKWEDSVLSAIKNVLKDSDYNLYIDYLDKDRFGSEGYDLELERFLTLKYHWKDLDGIIAMDDAAFQFILDMGSATFPDVPSVFCGVNYIDPNLMAESPRLQGVIQTPDIKRTLDLALRQNPQTQRVFVINDRTYTGLSNQKALEKVIPEFSNRLRFRFSGIPSLEVLEEQVSLFGEDTIILLLSFMRDGLFRNWSQMEVTQRISRAANVPVYGTRTDQMGEGIIGGWLLSAETQGKLAAEKMAAILDNRQSAPKIFRPQSLCILDYRQIQRFAMNPGAAPLDAEIRFGSLSLLERNPRAIVYGLAALTLIGGLFLLVIIFKSRRLHSQATTDPLTGILNRRAGMIQLRMALNWGKKNGSVTTVCFLDVDRLKKVNDELGHEKGDELLRCVAETLLTQIRGTDSAVRLGGDEFLLVMPETTADQARKIVGRISAKLASEGSRLGFPEGETISISFGIATSEPGHFLNETALLALADQEMYCNKQRGGELTEG